MSNIPPELSVARDRFMELVAELRPELHRYCSRLVGSAIDGEDVVQESLAKAYYAMSMSAELPPMRPWLFRIAHNTAIDFMRRYERRFVSPVAEIPDDAATTAEPVEHPTAVRLALSSFVALPVLQRSAVILKDVLDSSLEEIAQVLRTTVPAVKAALVRGRRALAAQPTPDVVPWRDRPETSPAERAQLDRYIALFNARNWSALQALLAEECELDLVAKAARKGPTQVSKYFGHYANDEVFMGLGEAEGRTVIGVFRPPSTLPAYVITIDWQHDRVRRIRDYRYVPYLMAELGFDRAHTPPEGAAT